MIKKFFVCVPCDKSFEIEIFEPGEAQEKRVNVAPVTCPICSSSNIFDPKKKKNN
jgi:hypothetical protein